jgi:hypothetical protein
MPNTTHSDRVPLNIWLPEEARTPTSGSAVRRHIADRLIETYSPPGGVVVDLCPGRGEVLAAASNAGRGAVVLQLPPGCARRPEPPTLDAVAGTADLAVALPFASDLWPPRAHPLSAVAAGVLSRRAAPLLRPGGVLVLATLGRTAATRRDPASGTVAAGGQAGLACYQHVVALLVHELAAHCGAPESRCRRRLAHADLLVFMKEER